MKKLIRNSAIAIAVLSAIVVIVSFTNSNAPKKEVLLVETYMLVEPTGFGLAIFHNDKPTEFIEMDYEAIFEEGEDVMRKYTEQKGAMLKSTMQKLYNDGWELEGTNGGDGIQRYILTK
ncbi:hypothetical protein N9164_09665 [Draconibacterium sp.]|nr:hypothetical protein [Draconibacterium sp.]